MPPRVDPLSMIKAHGVTHPGNVRPTNEDAMIWDLAIGFVAIADGMGGHQAGEVASNIALDSILNFMRRSAFNDDFTWPFGVDPALSLTANRLVTALRLGNRRVFRQSEEVPDYTGMGTTVVALVVEGSEVTYAGVGDSRMYAFRDGRLEQLTRDDSWLVMMSDEVGTDAETLRGHPLRNVLTSVIGARPELEVRSADLTLGRETLLLCTDGMHGAVSDQAMAAILSKAPDPQTAVDSLVRAALDAGGKDNITVVLVWHDEAAG
jgi:serine/threonine protein phosphatase PrpC